MQPGVNATEIQTVYEQQPSMAKISMCLSYNKTASPGCCISTTNSVNLPRINRTLVTVTTGGVLLERGDFVYPGGFRITKSFYEFGATRILNVELVNVSFEQHYLPLLPFVLWHRRYIGRIATFLTYIETADCVVEFSRQWARRIYRSATFLYYKPLTSLPRSGL